MSLYIMGELYLVSDHYFVDKINVKFEISELKNPCFEDTVWK